MTMNYYNLQDRMDDTPRWHIGKVTAFDGSPVHLCSGLNTTHDSLLSFVSYPGPPLQYSENSFGVPVAASSLADAIRKLAQDDVQVIPCTIDGISGHSVINTLRVVTCVDDGRSIQRRLTTEDGRIDRVGHYDYIRKLVLHGSQIPENVHIFRIWGWEVALIVSEPMKQAMEAAGCHGAVFVPVELS